MAVLARQNSSEESSAAQERQTARHLATDLTGSRSSTSVMLSSATVALRPGTTTAAFIRLLSGAGMASTFAFSALLIMM